MEETHFSKFWKASFPAFLIVFLMWFFYLLNIGIETDLNKYGVLPGETSGLVGVVASPMLHGSIEHIFNNSIPTLILVWAMFYSYKEIATKVIIYIWLVSGLLVWLTGSQGYHIGMSGVVYGLSGFLFLSGLIKKVRHLMGLSLLVIFLYGSLIWGVLPIKEGISWEGHLWGGITGLVMAVFYRKYGEQPKKYLWEYEEEPEDYDPETGEVPYWMKGVDTLEENQPSNENKSTAKPKTQIHYIYVQKNNPQDQDEKSG